MVVGVGVGVGGVVAAGGSRAVVVRAGARAAWSVERGWVGCLQRVREDGEVGQVGRGARLRAGTADARGCGREGRGARGEGRGARLFHCEPVWPIAGRLEASCLLGWAFAFVGRQKYKSKSTVRRRARQHLLMDAAEKASANQKTHGTGQLTAPQDFVKSHFVTNDFSPDIHVVYTVHGTVGAHTGILCRL